MTMKKLSVFLLLAALLTACPPTPTPDTTAPTTPSGFKATAGNAKVKLEWTANSETDLGGYTVRWGSSATVQNATIAIDKTANQHELTGLTNGTTYFFKLEAKDTAGNTSSSTAVVSATPIAPDTTAPTLTSSTPTANASNVPLNAQIQLTFSEAMNPNTVGVSSNNLTLGAATWNAGNTSVSFVTPALAFDTTYTLQLSGKDVAGNNLGGLTTLQFGTVNAPPTIQSTTPANNATDVPISSTITLRFSRSMNRQSVETAFSSTPSLTCTWAWLDGDQTAVCTPAAPMAFDTAHTLQVASSAQSAAGVNLQTVFSSSFRSERDLVQPALTSSVPADNATNRRFDTAITLNFSKPMNQSSVETAFSSNPAINCTWQWTSPQVANCQPNGRLNQQTEYQITLANTATDLVGNSLQAAYGFRFQVGNAPPKVLGFTPTGITPVGNNAVLSITFSEDMNKTATEAALQVVSQSVIRTGTITWNTECVFFSNVWLNCRTMRFTPTASYTSGTAVSWTVSTNALDLDSGAGLEANVTGNFTIRSNVGP
jgi:methionine-rich copper-binding protein CopC